MLRPFRNRGLLLVLVVAMLLAGAVAFAAGVLSEDSPGAVDVALTVDGVTVTFAELEIARQLMLANEEVEALVRQGDRLGFPEPMYEVYRELFTMTAEWRDRWPEDVRMVGGGATSAAIYAESVRRGVEPTDEAIASYVSTMIAMEDSIRESTEPGQSYAAALFEAQRSRFDERSYREDVLPRSARSSAAFGSLLQEMGLTPDDSTMLGTDLALAASIDVHRSLGVSADDVREYLREMRGLQLETLALFERLGEAMEADGLGFEQDSEEATPAP